VYEYLCKNNVNVNNLNERFGINAIELMRLKEDTSATFTKLRDLGDRKFLHEWKYTRISDKSIGQQTWLAFTVVSNYENAGEQIHYLTFRDDNVYFIGTTKGGPCSDDPQEVLSGFKFLN